MSAGRPANIKKFSSNPIGDSMMQLIKNDKEININVGVSTNLTIKLYDELFKLYNNFTYKWIEHEKARGRTLTTEQINKTKREKHPIKCWIEDRFSNFGYQVL